jgi:3-methylfumaryl-CoA hydratase
VTKPRRQTSAETVTEFAYRLVRPAFAGNAVEATARRHGTDLQLAVGTDHAGPSLTATATLGPPR